MLKHFTHVLSAFLLVNSVPPQSKQLELQAIVSERVRLGSLCQSVFCITACLKKEGVGLHAVCFKASSFTAQALKVCSQ